MNFKTLENIAMGNNDLMIKLLLSIKESMDTLIPQIYQSSRANDYKEVSSFAHKLKSSTGYIDYKDLNDTIDSLLIIKHNTSIDTSKITSEINNLKNYHSIANQALKQKLDELNDLN